ncbi:MAG: hypothetical protein N2323_05090 [candidate division WOR-3 bacterium]|nr:hypothetical protein [candidate division WOR-3 bacterium]
MRCEREKIFNYLSDLLPEEERGIIEKHLINCPTCQKYQKEFEIIKEELTKKEFIPDYSFFYEKLKERIRIKRRNFVLVSALVTSFLLIFSLSFLLLKKEKNKEEYILLEENYETLVDNLSSKEKEEILKELSKEIKEEDLILLEEKLEEEKDYYDLIFNLEKEELEYLIKNLKKRGRLK